MCLTVCLGIVSGWGWTKVGKNAISFAQSKVISITVKKQDGVPLLISGAYVDSNGLRPSYGYSLTNISGKIIRAYTIRDDVFLERRTLSKLARTRVFYF